MIAALLRLMRSWWRHDRIRASPLAGRLLRIKPGDVLTCDDIQAEVVSRTQQETSTGIRLCLTCDVPSGPVELELKLTPAGKLLTICWRDFDTCRPCNPAALEVWPRCP